MASERGQKDKDAEKPAPRRGGLRGRSSTPAADSAPSASAPPKKTSKKRKLHDIDEEGDEGGKKEDPKQWLENERQRRRDRLGAAQDLASIDNFDTYVRERNAARRIKSNAGVGRANQKVGGHQNFDPGQRQERHDQRLLDTQQYEDFMYFQCPRRRTQYEEDTEREKKNPFRKHQTAGRLWKSGPVEDLRMRSIVEDLEAREIGTLENIGADGIGPSDLHTLVPGLRREPVGLGERLLPSAAQEVNLSRINRDLIERRRREVDGDSATAGTHSARRLEEVAAMGDLPNDDKINNIVPTAQSMDRTRLQSGLFIAAGERSKDWLTSYNQLDIVRPGVYAVERHYLDPEDKGYRPPRSNANDEEDEDIPQPDDYPGFLNEFSKDARPHKKYAHRTTTVFAEATYGRREREHAHMFLEPFSPVQSPPHSPVYKSDLPLDVPSTHPDYKFYRTKFRDNYGATLKSWPELKEGAFTVRYEPLDIPALLEKQQARYQSKEEVLGDPVILDELRTFDVPAPDGTSMRLLREAKKMKYKPPVRPAKDRQGPWPEGQSADEDSGDDDGEESEDEGDLFRRAYLEASGITQGGPGGNGGNGGNGGGSDGKDPGPGPAGHDAVYEPSSPLPPLTASEEDEDEDEEEDDDDDSD